MDFRLEIRTIQDDHIFAVPKFSKYEFISVKTRDRLHTYITTVLRDDYGHKFKKASNKSKKLFGVDYTSHAGALIVEVWKAPKFKMV